MLSRSFLGLVIASLFSACGEGQSPQVPPGPPKSPPVKIDPDKAPWCQETGGCTTLHLRDLFPSGLPAHLPHLCVMLDGYVVGPLPLSENLDLPIPKDTLQGKDHPVVLYAMRSQGSMPASCEAPLCIGARRDLSLSFLLDGNKEVEPTRSLPLSSLRSRVTLSLAGDLAGTLQSEVDGKVRKCQINAREQPAECAMEVPSCRDLQLIATPDPGEATFAGWILGPVDTCSRLAQKPTGESFTLIPGAQEENGCSQSDVRGVFRLRRFPLQIRGQGPGSVRISYLDGRVADILELEAPLTKEYSFAARTVLRLHLQPGAASAIEPPLGCDRMISNTECEVTIREGHPGVSIRFIERRRLELKITGSATNYVTGPGLSCGPGAPGMQSCTQLYQPGETLALVARGPSTYLRWKGTSCGDVQTICTITMDQNRLVEVSF